MRWPWEKKTKNATRNLIIDDPDGFLGFALTGERITPQKAFDFYRQNSSIATAVDLIADSFEQIQPIIMKSDGSVIDRHPILDLLRNPNGYMAWSDYAARISRHYLLTHESHFYGLGTNTLAPLEIYPIKPTNISVTTGRDEYVDVFNVGTGVGEGRYIGEISKLRMIRYYDGLLKELYRISGFSSMSTDGSADSPLQAAALEANQQIKGRIHNLKLLDNGGRMSLLIVFKDETHLTDDEHRERTQQINESLGGVKNAGKIGVMSGGDVSEVREMGTTNKDMDYAELDRIASRSIYFRYKIPLPLIETSASTFNNMQTAVEMLYDWAVLPLADKLFSGMTRFLMPRFGVDVNDFRITYNPDSLQPLKQRRLNELEQRKKVGVETINELRESIPNRENVDGGDVLYQPATMVPVGVDAFEDQTVDERMDDLNGSV